MCAFEGAGSLFSSPAEAAGSPFRRPAEAAGSLSGPQQKQQATFQKQQAAHQKLPALGPHQKWQAASS